MRAAVEPGRAAVSVAEDDTLVGGFPAQTEADEAEEVVSLRLRLDRMTALDKLKSDFMNLTTHELRSPLAIVYGYLSMMESGMLGELSPELREAVASSIQSVELMTQLVSELVEMARLDETRLDLTREPVDLAEVVAEAGVRVESSDRHQLRLDLAASPAPVLGDRGQLLRVFGNIVDNAVKYSPAGGEIGIRMRRSGRQVAVDITDPGLGIAPSDMDRLFTRFGRIVTAANEGIGGTGLGLYLCRELVRRLGGDITATSVEGRGSTFTVRLPAAHRVAAARTQG
jgi:signal transduction histidine kinase